MKKHIKVLAFIAMIGIANIGYTQTVYKIQDSKDIAIKLKGTSTLHDWEMGANNATGEAQLIFKPGSESELASMKSLTFKLEVKDLQSDSKELDKNAYKALNTDKHKYILYKLSSATESPENGGYLLKTKGKLTVAGVTKEIAMDIHVK